MQLNYIEVLIQILKLLFNDEELNNMKNRFKLGKMGSISPASGSSKKLKRNLTIYKKKKMLTIYGGTEKK